MSKRQADALSHLGIEIEIPQPKSLKRKKINSVEFKKKNGTESHKYVDSSKCSQLAEICESRSTFHRMVVDSHGLEHTISGEKAVAKKIKQALDFRKQFIWYPPHDLSTVDKTIMNQDLSKPDKDLFEAKFQPTKPLKVQNKIYFSFKMVEGVVQVWKGEPGIHSRVVFGAPSREEFIEALTTLMSIISDGPCKTFAHKRLQILEARFNLHKMMNGDLEKKEAKATKHRDFYNIRKIDNHIHHSACMNQKKLLRFIKRKLKEEGNRKVARDGVKEITLKEIFNRMNIKPYDLNIDALGMRADDTFHRFDKFNLKYNPIDQRSLREVFLKYNNHIKGKYLAELTQEVFDDLESNKYQFAEYRLSIYGRDPKEWDMLAEWVVDNNLFSNNVRWMIQIPRLFKIYRMRKELNCFQEMLDNIFIPLFEVSINPQSHPKLDMFLQQVVGFDSVDDESKREPAYGFTYPHPKRWTKEENPPYAMFTYYMYANLVVLNKLRFHNNLPTFAFRPHAGEAGDIEHLVTTFLLAHSINHGIVLKSNPTLQYLYYLTQIGISVSPLSNNLLWIEYENNPFPRFFARGLNVTLSTDDPLLIHVTKEPLMEEYSIASQVWKFSSVDLSEIVRNSVLQSGFEHIFKCKWLGSNYFKLKDSNEIQNTNVPTIRIEFRLELITEEFAVLSSLLGCQLGWEYLDAIPIRCPFT